MDDKYQILKQYFGYTAFRDGQERIIDGILKGEDVVGIMPTGAGKSLCFQIPAIMMEGITLVISPLISLMKDQVNALVQTGVKAAYINSSLSAAQLQRVMQNAVNGQYKIIYVAPERLLTDDFQSFVQKSIISMVTIDEAHCVSQWGQDFRPSYLLIEKFIEKLPDRPAVSAFTATATGEVRDDIMKLLKLNTPMVVSTGFDRKNLYFEVKHPKDKMAALLNILKNYDQKSGIIYCSTRKNVEEVCAVLRKADYSATRYHAGLSDQERKLNQEDFLYDRSPIMAATNAFGMGIDKSNVSFVIHYNMPKDIESYYQEAGRAGRDGEPADCILLYSGQDVITNQFFIEHGNENDVFDDETREILKCKERERLKVMTFYCHTNECLRSYILDYFGEKGAGFCGKCFNCNNNSELIDITIDSQKILSCVKRTRERYGVKTIIDTLRGSKAQKLIRLDLDKQSTYGIMRDTGEVKLRAIVNFLALNDYLHITNDEYPIVKLGAKANDILLKKNDLEMKIIKEQEKSNKQNYEDEAGRGFKGKSQRGRGKKSKILKDNISGNYADEQLFDQLRELRFKIAQEQGVPAFVVFSNATLTDMCVRLPETEEEMLEVNGVGQAKLERYGSQFLKVISDYLQLTAG
ncbi:MAG: DNA helicase RecQ [Bacillota bacterium]